jgi:hypothetical protein
MGLMGMWSPDLRRRGIESSRSRCTSVCFSATAMIDRRVRTEEKSQSNSYRALELLCVISIFFLNRD